MGTRVNHSTSYAEIFERLMLEEREAADSYRRKAEQTEDPTLQSIFAELAEKRDRFYIELESQLREMTSQKEITTQINAMFW